MWRMHTTGMSCTSHFGTQISSESTTGVLNCEFHLEASGVPPAGLRCKQLVLLPPTAIAACASAVVGRSHRQLAGRWGLAGGPIATAPARKPERHLGHTPEVRKPLTRDGRICHMCLEWGFVTQVDGRCCFSFRVGVRYRDRAGWLQLPVRSPVVRSAVIYPGVV